MEQTTQTNRNTISETNLHTEITRIMTALCFTPKYSGYKCLREGIKMAVLTDEQACLMTKYIYPELAKKLGVTSAAVERGIRHAIKIAWNRTDDRTKYEMFGMIAQDRSWIPTNSEMIFMIADRIRCRYELF